ncbi:MAG: IscS subfamily cysteine desulfurase, partial [Thermoplasmata archaeon]|nr:IscS subfamily cysteine desulfurase [Thermoplasmata archaeon]
MKRIYMDHAATTPVDPEVLKAMQPYFTEYFGNASSFHAFGREVKETLENAREQVAAVIGANSQDIIFTAGGTESDNIAIKGTVASYLKKHKLDTCHVITSKIEHPAVTKTCEFLETQGFSVTYLPVDNFGVVSPEEVANNIQKDTALITIMHANNEIGTIEPIAEIGKIAHENDIIFHTDAVQSFGKVPIEVDKMNIDLLSVSSHKIYGPKGVGTLYVRKGIKLEPFVHGGGQERGLRSSTENIPGIVGLGKASELSRQNMEQEHESLSRLRDKIIKNVSAEIEEAYLNGHPTERLPHNAHFWFNAIEGESIILSLDEVGIAASTGSACSTAKLEPSHVLLAIGLK